jgi:YebC/PmpR family DNA-binding regulatory protein
MAGHNKWSKVKHRKAVVDKRKGKALSMCSRMIISAVRQHGPDPAFNSLLRAALDEARYHNVPNDNIERAIKKGAGAGEGDSFEHVRYEGYGPGGAAVIVDALTDNRTRTAANVRNIFNEHGGRMGTTGSVSHQFEHKGRIVIAAPASAEDAVLEAALAAGAEDVRSGDEAGAWTVLTAPQDFLNVRKALDEARFTIAEGELDMIPTLTVVVSGQTAKDFVEFVDALEDDEDVKKVYSNADIPEAELAGMD